MPSLVGLDNIDNLRETGKLTTYDEIIDHFAGKGIRDDILIKNIVNIFSFGVGKSVEDVYDDIHTGNILGSGVLGVVRKATHRATGIEYAVKCIDLSLKAESLKHILQQIFIMSQLDHPNIIRLQECYSSEKKIYLVQELCTGGELFDRLDEQPDYHYSEEQCARLVKQMLSAVEYIHSKRFIHRNLTLENFLLSSYDADAELKLVGFGLSEFQSEELLHEEVGTLNTVAPEVIRGNYDERCDIWSIGVLTYLLLSGEPPFGGCDGAELTTVRSKILSGNFVFDPPEIWDNVSSEAKDFIRSLLVTDPTQRPTASQAQKSTWLERWTALITNENSLSPDDTISSSSISPDDTISSSSISPDDTISSRSITSPFDPDFVHSCYTCIDCGASPIVGYRYYAINIPDFDLCLSCKNKGILPDINFVQAQEGVISIVPKTTPQPLDTDSLSKTVTQTDVTLLPSSTEQSNVIAEDEDGKILAKDENDGFEDSFVFVEKDDCIIILDNADVDKNVCNEKEEEEGKNVSDSDDEWAMVKDKTDIF